MRTDKYPEWVDRHGLRFEYDVLGERADAMTFDWTKLAPDWANWHTTDSSGAAWWQNEPRFDLEDDRYVRTTGEYQWINTRPLPATKTPRHAGEG